MHGPRAFPLAASAVVAVLLATSCRTAPSESVEQTAPTPSGAAKKAGDAHILFVPAPDGDVSLVVQTAVTHAREQGRRLVVYEGASWCEPCKHFHEAVAKGELDKEFPDVTLLEFDADHDRERLVAAGYGSQYIPLFALPGKDGRAAGPKAQGGIKGESVVPYLAKKLQQILSQGS